MSSTIETIDKAWRTAITRKALSKPVRRLSLDHLLVGRLLDYGCGRGSDADEVGCEGYDPHFQPRRPVGTFKTIMCNYVLNVIESDEVRREVLTSIDALLDDDGCAYITVRANKKDLKGRTRIGTWQGLITLNLPVVYKDSDSVTYRMSAGRSDCEMIAEIFPDLG